MGNFPFLQGLVALTSAVRMADVCPGAYCVMTGTWTTVAMAVTRTPIPQPAAEVSDRDGLDPTLNRKVERLAGPNIHLLGGRARVGR